MFKTLKERILEFIMEKEQTWGEELFYHLGFERWDYHNKQLVWKLIEELIFEKKISGHKESHHIRFLTPYNKGLIVRFPK